MPARSNPLVVVITGASSGIGRATAHAFARRGASVVLAARRVEMLHEVERECAEFGGTALVVPTATTPRPRSATAGPPDGVTWPGHSACSLPRRSPARFTYIPVEPEDGPGTDRGAGPVSSARWTRPRPSGHPGP